MAIPGPLAIGAVLVVAAIWVVTWVAIGIGLIRAAGSATLRGRRIDARWWTFTLSRQGLRVRGTAAILFGITALLLPMTEVVAPNWIGAVGAILAALWVGLLLALGWVSVVHEKVE